LWKTLDAKAFEHSTLRTIVTSVYDALGARNSRPGSSLHGRVEALYTRVGERLKDTLPIGMKRTQVVVSSHYLSIDLPVVSEGYVVGDDEDEAREEVRKLTDTKC